MYQPIIGAMGSAFLPLNDPVKIAQQAKETGFDAMHATWMAPWVFEEEKRDYALRGLTDVLEGSRFEVPAVAVVPSGEGYRKPIEVAEAHIRFAADLGARYVTQHFPPMDCHYDEAVTYLRQLVDLARDYSVKFLYETGHDPKETVDNLLNDVSNLFVCLDLGNWVSTGYSPEQVFEWAEDLLGHVAMVHLKNAEQGILEERRGNFTALNEGALDLDQYIRMLDELFRNIPVIIEESVPITEDRSHRLLANLVIFETKLDEYNFLNGRE